SRQGTLPVAVARIAERVLPAEVVPIVDVEGDRYYLRAGHRRERREPAIRRRAALTPFRRIELEERGRAGTRACDARISGHRRGMDHEEGQEVCEAHNRQSPALRPAYARRLVWAFW